MSNRNQQDVSGRIRRDGFKKDGFARDGFESVREAFGRLTKGLEAAKETDGQFRSRGGDGGLVQAPPSARLGDQLSVLFKRSDFIVSGAERRELQGLFARTEQISEEVTSAAFDWASDSALDDAHRSLYALYADRVWRVSHQPRPFWAETAFRRIQHNLEVGFRSSLARSRESRPLDEYEDDHDFAALFDSLALAERGDGSKRWIDLLREEISLEQLQEVIAQRALFYLRRPDPWLYAIPALKGTAKAGLTEVVFDEYGRGRFDRFYATAYASLLEGLGMDRSADQLEVHTSWQCLATLNHQWMCALTPELHRRLLGIIYWVEATSREEMSGCLAAWARCGNPYTQLSELYKFNASTAEANREVVLNDVLVPVCELEPDSAVEIARGIVDAKALEEQFASHLVSRFARRRPTLEVLPDQAATARRGEAQA